MGRKTKNGFVAFVAGTAILFAAESSAQARFFSVASSPHLQMGNIDATAPVRTRGFGRGWCYWHPYVCYRG